MATYSVARSDLESAFEVYQRIPEFSDRDTLAGIRERVGPDYLSLVCRSGDEPVGFKLGYPLDTGEFYSWLGGVVPGHRGGGIAQALLEAQEQHCRERGYELLRVKSMNRFPAMLQLLIRNGYQVDGHTPASEDADIKVHFHKRL